MKYQSVTNPDVIVKAIQFDPHKHPWPEGVVPHPKDAKPKDMTWGYVDTDERRVHVMAGYYIVTDSLDKKHVYERGSFEYAYRPVAVVDEPKESSPKITVHIQEEHFCGQIHEQVYVLEKRPALTLHTRPKLPGDVIAARGITLVGRYEAVEINGIEMRDNRLLCNKCGEDVLFPNPRFVRS